MTHKPEMTAPQAVQRDLGEAWVPVSSEAAVPPQPTQCIGRSWTWPDPKCTMGEFLSSCLEHCFPRDPWRCPAERRQAGAMHVSRVLYDTQGCSHLEGLKIKGKIMKTQKLTVWREHRPPVFPHSRLAAVPSHWSAPVYPETWDSLPAAHLRFCVLTRLGHQPQQPASSRAF